MGLLLKLFSSPELKVQVSFMIVFYLPCVCLSVCRFFTFSFPLQDHSAPKSAKPNTKHSLMEGIHNFFQIKGQDLFPRGDNRYSENVLTTFNFSSQVQPG